MPDHRDAILRHVTLALGTSNKHTYRNNLKRALAAIWRALPVEDRRSFVGKIGDDMEFLEFRKQFPGKSDSELELAARYWPYVLQTLSAKELSFGKSIATSLKQNRKLSDKQIAYMKKLYRDYKKFPEPDMSVIE